MLLTIALMIMGLLTVSLRTEINPSFILHTLLVVVLSACLLLYPKYETHTFRRLLILLVFTYFYMLFFLYPETLSTFVLLCLIPAFSIYFFDSKLFYFSLFLNSLLVMATFFYIMLVDKGVLFQHINQDLFGNVINFIASQVIIFLIYYFSYVRLKRQQLYYENLQHSERIKATGQLASAIAHEIRNPLTVVKGFLELSKEDTSISNAHKRHFTLMIDELNTAEEVISQFLTLSKPNTDKKIEIVDVKDSLTSVADLLKSYGILYENKIDLHVEEDCYISANKIEFKQLMINIIKNAIEASSIGDSVSILAKRSDDYVEMRIIDDGCGMSEVEVKSLGSPFYTLKSKGTGLGLMICYNIVEKQNGTIQFQSSKGEGTTVIIRFPLKNTNNDSVGIRKN